MKNKKFILVIIIYLLGLFMGALDTGIVTPARAVIQSSLNVDASTGIWMITIYTLFYAASIPVMGKLADLYGRKVIYLVSIFMFGAGSLFCGLAGVFDSFTVLVCARAFQAIGGGGVMPVATAEIGTSFPPEKRGMGLGLVGGVYGIANVFGASAGSAIMDIFGTDNWAYIFYINVPITILIVVIGIFTLENHKEVNDNKLDLAGIVVLTSMIFSLLYGLKKLDFFDFKESITSPDVYRYLIIFAVLLPVFIFIEKKAKDPVMNLEYFRNRNITIALLVSILSGVALMGMIFVPQFSENVLKLATGSGGYMVIVMGIFAGVGAPVSGRLVDKYGAKAVLTGGFICVGLGSLFLVFITAEHPGLLTVVIGLVIVGLGIGFTMGTPLNYIMLANTDPKESNSALATMSLVRSIGTAVAPAIMVGFIAHAGLGVQDNIMNILPQEITVGKLPHYEEIMEKMDELKGNDQFKDMEIPDMGDMTSVNFSDMGDSDYEMPEELIQLLQNSDVTTITDNMKIMTEVMFSDMTPDIIKDICDGIEEGRDGIKEGKKELATALSEMQEGYDGIGEGISGMKEGAAEMKTAESQMTSAIANIKDPSGLNALNKQIKKMNSNISSMTASRDQMQQYVGYMDKMGGSLPPGKKLTDFIPEDVKSSIPADTLKQLEGITTSAQLQALCDNMTKGIEGQKTAVKEMKKSAEILDDLVNKGVAPKGKSMLDVMPDNVKPQIPKDVQDKLAKAHSVSDLEKMKSELVTARKELENKITEMEESRKEMKSAMSEMKDARKEMTALSANMKELEMAVPGAFEEAKDKYIEEIEKNRVKIEEVFQATLNEGFKNIYTVTLMAAILGIFLLLFYSRKRERNQD